MTAKKDIDEFIRQSNAIEGVHDEESFEDAMNAWRHLMKRDKLTRAVVLETHKLLMARQPIEGKQKGAFRKQDVWVGKRKGSPAAIVPLLVGDFCARTMNYRKKPDAQALHVLYEHIHPFIDGNGRTGRMFLNWTRLKITREPLLIIKASERKAYYKWFRQDIITV